MANERSGVASRRKVDLGGMESWHDKAEEEAKWNHIWWHNGTVNLTLKNIPDAVYQGLKSTASDRGRSLNAQAIRLLAEAVELASRRKRIANSMDELRRFKATLPRLSSSVPLIREDRKRR
jgi:hypothetical protein